MRRARALRYALAAALAAVALPFAAHAAFGEEGVATPTAQVFPTRDGIGVTWQPVGATTYRVERKLATSDWQDASGNLAETTTWIDNSLTPGASAEYRVVASSSAGENATSTPLSATRAAMAPVVGDGDVLALDANRGAGTTWLQNEVADTVTASAPVGDSRTLAAGSLKVRIPAFFPGPGRYSLSQSQVELTQGARSCTTSGYLWVDELAYTPDLGLETMAASLHVYTCASTDVTAAIDIRYRSSVGYEALSTTPDHLDAGRLMQGKTSEPLPITVRNTGTEPMKIENVELDPGAAMIWRITSNGCVLATLPAAGSCTLTVTFQAGPTGLDRSVLTVTDHSSLGKHVVALSGTSVSLPGEMLLGVSSTFNGHTLRWTSLPTAGGTPVRGYFLHRYLNGTETTQWFDAKPWASSLSTTEINPQPGTEYAVSVVNEIGEGPVGQRRAAIPASQQIAIVDGAPESAELKAADIDGNIVPFPSEAGSVKPTEAVASAPDGRTLAYVTNDQERVLWTRRVVPNQLGVPAKLWSSPLPITHLSWSPDGTRIAFQAPEDDGENARKCVYVIAATGGTPERIDCGLSNPSWMPDALTLMVVDRRVNDDAKFARIQAKPGGARVSVLPAPAIDTTAVRVSPSGNWVAFAQKSTVALTNRWSARVISSPALDSAVRAFTWAADGNELLVLTASGRIARIPVSSLGEMTAWGPVVLGDKSYGTTKDLAWQRLGVTIKPTPAVSGSQISIPFDSSALPSGTTFTCTLSGQPSTACTSPVTASGLLSGDYVLTITAKEASRRETWAYRSFTVDASGPVARVDAPTVAATTAGTAAVKVSASDSAGVSSYDVRYRKALWLGGFGAYVQPWTATTATSMNLAMDPGYEYCVSVRAKDKLGNVGAWSGERCIARPLDDRSMGAPTAGWSRVGWSAFYLSTATQTSKSGASLTRTVQGKRFYLVATRCPTCGLVAVYANGKYIGAVNLASATTQRQALLALPVQSSIFNGTLTFTVRSPSGKGVQIDGLVVRKT